MWKGGHFTHCYLYKFRTKTAQGEVNSQYKLATKPQAVTFKEVIVFSCDTAFTICKKHKQSYPRRLSHSFYIEFGNSLY